MGIVEGRRRIVWGAIGWALLAWALATVAALALGGVSDASSAIIRQIRVPRAILASAVGMALSVAGAALQALFCNPLCEPYTLGVSSGAALGAVIGVSLGWHAVVSGIALPAVAGALVFAGLLYAVAARNPRAGSLTVLLTGVMLGFLGSSLVAVWMALVDSNGIQSAMIWLLGDLSRARIEGATVTLALVVGVTALLWLGSSELDAFLMGEEDAASLGVDVPRARRRVILLASVLVGLAVSAGGMIGFVGLVVPHFARRMVGARHAALIPVVAVLGAAALTAADALARSVTRPYDLPVGVVTALIGAPLFLSIFTGRMSGRGRGDSA